MGPGWKWPTYMYAKIYALNPDADRDMMAEIKRNQLFRDSVFANRPLWQDLFQVDPFKRSYERKKSKRERKEFFKSIAADSIKKGIIASQYISERFFALKIILDFCKSK